MVTVFLSDFRSRCSDFTFKWLIIWPILRWWLNSI